VRVEVGLDLADQVRDGVEAAAASALSVRPRNQRSTRLSHDDEVGVKCR
jgi:hypothetical protein